MVVVTFRYVFSFFIILPPVFKREWWKWRKKYTGVQSGKRSEFSGLCGMVTWGTQQRDKGTLFLVDYMTGFFLDYYCCIPSDKQTVARLRKSAEEYVDCGVSPRFAWYFLFCLFFFPSFHRGGHLVHSGQFILIEWTFDLGGHGFLRVKRV